MESEFPAVWAYAPTAEGVQVSIGGVVDVHLPPDIASRVFVTPALAGGVPDTPTQRAA